MYSVIEKITQEYFEGLKFMNDGHENLEMLSSLIFRFYHLLMMKSSSLHFKCF